MDRGNTTSTAPLVIALAGMSQSGKDTIADYLSGHHGYQRVAVADRLKQVVGELFGLSRRQLWGDRRDVVDTRLGQTPRVVYQRFSDACLAIDAQVWLRPFEAVLRQRLDQRARTVWADLRTPAELELARRLGARTVRVVRPGFHAVGDAANHATERAMAERAASEFDVHLVNDGTLDDLHASVRTLVLRGVA